MADTFEIDGTYGDLVVGTEHHTVETVETWHFWTILVGYYDRNDCFQEVEVWEFEEDQRGANLFCKGLIASLDLLGKTYRWENEGWTVI